MRLEIETRFGEGFQPFLESGFHRFLLLQRDAFTYKCFYTGRAFAQRWFYAERWFYKGMLLLAGALVQRYFQHRDAFTHGCLKIQILLTQRWFCKEKLLDAEGFTHSCLCTEMLLHRCFDTLIRLHSAFTDTFFYPEIPLHALRASTLHRDILTHSGRRVYMQILLHGNVYFVHVFFLHPCMLLRRDAFNHTCFYTEMFLHRDTFNRDALHRDAFTHRKVFTRILLQRDDFTLSNFIHRCQNKRRSFYKGMY